MMDQDGLNKMAEDIKAHGQRLPIILFEGKILDGRNRYLACKMAGVWPFYKELPDGEDPVAYAESMNLPRRDLTVSQRAMYADNKRNYYEAEAKKRRLATLKQGDNAPVKDMWPERDKGQARDRVGNTVGVSGKTMDRAKKVREKGVPELAKRYVCQGVKALPSTGKSRDCEVFPLNGTWPSNGSHFARIAARTLRQ
jgi:hypothetical protein